MIIANAHVRKDAKTIIKVPLGHTYDGSELTMDVIAIRGKTDGTNLFISAGIHGDEIIGTAIVADLAKSLDPSKINGTVLLIPSVNPFGFIAKSRYMPDRRDLNRCFSGKLTGSLAHRVAYIFTHEIIKNCDYGIDLHSGAIHKTNLPQIRATLDDEELMDMAERFCAPVTLNSKMRDGSMRKTAYELGCKVILYEAGEALRIDQAMVRRGVDGCLSVMESLHVIEDEIDRADDDTYVAMSSYWVRAAHAGLYFPTKRLGEIVSKGDEIGYIQNTLGEIKAKMKAPSDGIIIGAIQIPLVNRGDAITHIASTRDKKELEKVLDDLVKFFV